MSLSNKSPQLAASRTLPTEETGNRSSNRTEPIRFTRSLKVIDSDTSEDPLSPIRAKALLTAMSVKHEQDDTYRVTTREKTVTSNLSTTSCTCNSTLPERGKRCMHLEHLVERIEQDLLPGTTTPPQPIDGDQSKMDEEHEEQPGRDIECPHCGRDIGQSEHSRGEIAFMTCNVCALDNQDIYHFFESPSENSEPELVYLNQLICNGDTSTYYHDSSTMSVYEFFTDHPDVTPDDSVVLVHRRLHDPLCNGLLFETKPTAVPGSLLQKAIETLHSLSQARENETTVETDEETTASADGEIVTDPSPA